MNPESKKKLRVVIVDDHQQTRDGLSALLEFSEEIEVINQASTGWDALHVVAQEPPDLVFMDVQMSFGNGIETTRQIKKRWPDTDVLVMSAHPNPEHSSWARREGARDFIRKPFSWKQLAGLMRLYVESIQPAE